MISPPVASYSMSSYNNRAELFGFGEAMYGSFTVGSGKSETQSQCTEVMSGFRTPPKTSPEPHPKPTTTAVYSVCNKASDINLFMSAGSYMRVYDSGLSNSIEMFGTDFGGIVYDSDYNGWAGCYCVNSEGGVAMGDSSRGQFCQNPCLIPLVLATGKMFNQADGCHQSGFWVSPRVFLATLRFSNWMSIDHLPTELEVQSYRNEPNSQLYVSTEIANEAGPDDDGGAVKVLLAYFDLQSDVGLFFVQDFNINIKHYVEPSTFVELSSLPMILNRDDWLVAFGYNGEFNPTEIHRWKSAYLQQLSPERQSAIGIDPEPNYRYLLRPHRKTASVGRAKGYDSSVSEILVNCPFWRGFSGGPVAVLNSQGAMRVVALVRGGQRNSLYNRCKPFPDGFVSTCVALTQQM